MKTKGGLIVSDAKLGSRWTKPDLERIGLFAEMAYFSARTFKKPKYVPENRNLYCEGYKTKNGTQHGYFEPEFKRIFENDRGRKPKPQIKIERPFMPPPGFKLHSSPGDYYGCFSGIIEAMSNKRVPKKKYVPELRNFYTSPAKKGGPGYKDITISPYPEHKPDRYGLKPKYKQYGANLDRPLVTMNHPQAVFDKNPFKDPEKIKPGPTYVRPKDVPQKVLPPGYLVPPGKGKLKGGCQAGCFDKFPEFKTNRNIKLEKQKKPTEPVFFSSYAQPKSYYNTSIVNHNVDFRLNSTNLNTFEPVFTKFLVAE